MKKPIIPTTKQVETSNLAYKIKELSKNDITLAKTLGITKTTLYTRFRVSNWKPLEIFAMPFLLEKAENDSFDFSKDLLQKIDENSEFLNLDKLPSVEEISEFFNGIINILTPKNEKTKAP